jgi:hypothetical protein
MPMANHGSRSRRSGCRAVGNLPLAGKSGWKRGRPALTQTTTLAIALVIAIILGAGGYTLGNSNAHTTTVTQTLASTTTETMAGASSAASNVTSFTVYGGGTTQVAERLVVDTATMQGSYSALGLAPQWLQSSPTSNYLNYPSITEVTSLGIGPMSDALLAEADGVPITIVGSFSGAPASTTFFGVSGGNVTSAADLAGQKVGVVSATRSGSLWLTGIYYAKRMGINFTMIPEGNATNAVNALTSGKTGAMLGLISPLMPQGSVVTIVNPDSVWATPFAGSAIWATTGIVKSNPTLVQKFVNATLSAVNYLVQNSSYAGALYTTDFQGSPLYTLPASSTVANINYTPNGMGGNSTLLASVTDSWAFYSLMCTGSCKANMTGTSAIDTSFLPDA